MIQVEPDFKRGVFVYKSPTELPTSIGDLVGVEYSKLEARVPFDSELVSLVRAQLRSAGLKVQASAEAIEAFKYVVSQEKTLQNQVAGLENLALPDDLYFHQKLAIRFAHARNYAGLFLEMGLGKTRCALELLKLSKWRGHTLVLAPKSVLGAWQKEASRWSPDNCRAFIASGTAAQKAKDLEDFYRYCRVAGDSGSSIGILVTNYETILSDRFLRPLLRFGFHTVICDESIYLKNKAAKRTRAAWKLAKSAKHRLILTGEPMTQGIEDLFGQLGFLSTDIFGKTIGPFRNRYCDIEVKHAGGNSFQEIVGHKNLDELSRTTFKHCITLSKHQCLDLPPKIYQTRYVTMSSEQRKAYRRMNDEFIANIEGDIVYANGILPQIAKLTQITSGFAYSDDKATEFAENPKAKEVQDIAQDVCRRGKLVVWCRFRAEVDILRRVLAPFGVVFIDGRVEQQVRQEAINLFQDDPSKRVFVGQIQAAGMGITLTAAHTAVFYSNSWSLSERKQAEDRIHRIGQGNACLYLDLICKDTIDEAILEALTSKATLSKQVTKKEWGKLASGT